MNMEEKPGHGLSKPALTAYISDSTDREGNTFYQAAICDEEKHAIIEELSDYDRQDLINEVLRLHPDIEVENG